MAAGELFSNLVRLELVDSTNRYAVAAAATGAPEGLVVVADEQTAGRGRLGRRWLAGRGEALLCSILFRPPLAPEDLHLVPTAVVLAACDAASRQSGVPVGIKWPNDLITEDDRKVGGMLAEFVEPTAESRSVAVVVGVGINLAVSAGLVELVRASDPDAAAAIAGLRELGGFAVGRDELLEDLLQSLRDRYPTLGRAKDRTMDEYRFRCRTIGRLVRVETAGGEVRGLAAGIADDGRLEVDVDGHRSPISAADVVHLRDEG